MKTIEIKHSESLEYLKDSIIIIDDNPEFLDSVASAVEHSFTKIESYQNPLEAFARLKEVEFDVVLTDLSMPGMGGLEILQHLQSQSESLSVPMVMSAYTDKERVLRAFFFDCYDVIEKPFDLLHLTQRTRHALAFSQTKRKQIEMIQVLYEALDEPLRVNLKSLSQSETLQIWESCIRLLKMRNVRDAIGKQEPLSFVPKKRKSG